MSDLVHRFNYFKYRFKYRYGQYLNLKAPVDISLELASACNQACVYCYHADKASLPFQQKIMSFPTAERILKQGAALGVHSVKFNYRGEPTLNPAFISIAYTAKAYAFGSTYIDRVINSNFKFSARSDDIIRALCAMTKVKCSFDSFRKDVFETQRAGAIYELALANLKKFHDSPYRKDTILVVQAVRTQANKDEDLAHEIKKRFPDAIASIRDVVEGRVDKDLSDTLVKERSDERQSCLQAHVRLIFDHAGSAQMCCPDIGSKIQLGNIHIHTIDEMFNSIKAKRIRKQLRERTAFAMEPCRSCPSHESYKGYKPGWDS